MRKVMAYAASAFHKLYLFFVNADNGTVRVCLSVKSDYEAVGQGSNLIFVSDTCHRASLRNDVFEVVEEIKQFLISQGIKAEDISQGTPTVQDLHADFYGTNLPPERYRMEMAVSVATDAVDTVLKAMSNQSELIQKGVLFTQNYRTQFSFNGLNAIKPEMVEEATKNARSTAQKFAEDSDSELGKIRRASQGQFTIYDRDSNTPYVKRVRVVTTVEYYLKD